MDGDLEEILHFLALAADFDGTLAHHGSIAPDTIHALYLLKETGRRLVLVTGREMADLQHAVPELELFDRIVAENGGVIHDPATGRENAIASAPPAALVQKLMERHVEPISVGRTVVATWHPHETAVLDAIRDASRADASARSGRAQLHQPSAGGRGRPLRLGVRE